MELVRRIVLVDVRDDLDHRRRFGGQGLAQGAAKGVGGLDPPGRHAERAGIGLEIGIVLTLLPWIPQGTLGLSDWGNNYFLLYAARKTGFYTLQSVVASGWMRGAVTGVGLLNIGIAFWEIFHFKQSVAALQHSQAAGDNDDPRPSKTNPLSDHQRRDDRADHSDN